MAVADAEPAHHRQQQQELDAKPDHIAGHRAKGYHEAWKINFAKDGRIGDEGIARGREAGAEIIPDGDAGQVKHDRFDAVCGYVGDLAKYKEEHDRREHRLYKMPQRPQDRLLVLRHEIAFYKQYQQVAVPPYLLQVEVQQFAAGFYYLVPVFGLGGQGVKVEGRFESSRLKVERVSNQGNP